MAREMVFTQQQAETELQSNLKEGEVLSLSLQLPVTKARAVLRHDTESDIRALWEHILEGFDLWKLERGSRTIKPAGLLSPIIDFDAAPAYLCTEYGASIEGWGSFFFKLLSDEYFPITHLVEHLSIQTILSILILVEAAEGRVEQVRLLYDRLTLSLDSENFSQRHELLDKYLELIPTASKAREIAIKNSKSASLPRSKDNLTRLVRRTIEGLIISGKKTTPSNIAKALGAYDTDGVLGYVNQQGSFIASTDCAGQKSYYKLGIVTCMLKGVVTEVSHKNLSDRRDNYLKAKNRVQA